MCCSKKKCFFKILKCEGVNIKENLETIINGLYKIYNDNDNNIYDNN